MNVGEGEGGEIDINALDLADKWILGRLNTVIKEVTGNLDSFDLNMAAQKIYDFIWSEFCDWYIEMAKPRLYGEDAADKENVKTVLVRVLTDSMKLLHPFMPFITEELYLNLPGSEETIMLSDWPKWQAEFDFPTETQTMDGMMEIIRAIRNLRAERNVPPARRTAMTLVAKPENAAACEAAAIYVTRLAGGSSVKVQGDKAGVPENAVSLVCPLAEVCIPLEELVGRRQGAGTGKQRDCARSGRNRTGPGQAEQPRLYRQSTRKGGGRGAGKAQKGAGDAEHAQRTAFGNEVTKVYSEDRIIFYKLILEGIAPKRYHKSRD